MQTTVQSGESLLRDLPRQIVQRGAKAGAGDIVGGVEVEKRRMVRFSNNVVTVVQTWDITSPIIYLGFGTRSIASRLSDTSTAAVDESIQQMLPAVNALPETVESHIPRGPFQYKECPGAL